LLVISLKQKIKFWIAAKTILIYEIISFVIFIIYPKIILVIADVLGLEREGNKAFLVVDFLLFCAILFLFFGILSKKYLFINFKKSIIIFILLALIMPLVNEAIIIISQPIYSLSVLRGEEQKFLELFQEKGLFFGVEYEQKYPVLSITEKFILSINGPMSYFREIFLFL